VPDTSKRKRATIGILVGLLLAALDGTVVATAQPRILDDLKGFQVYFLIAATFMLCQTVSMPIWGRLSDIYGRGRFHLLAVTILVGGSLLCGTAHSMKALVGYRAIQGLGAGGMMSLSFTMIADLYDLEERAKMQGAISSVWGIASIIGPMLGGWITDHWSWRWIFFLNLPVGIVSAIFVQAGWEKRPGGGAGKVDVAGAALLALTSAAFLLGFGLAGNKGWLRPETLASFGATLVLATVLVLVERKTAQPFIAYDLYRIRLFTTGAATGICAMVCLFAAVFHIPLLVDGVMGKELQKGGYMLTCMMFPWMVCSALTKQLLKRFSYRTLAIVGMILSGTAYALLSRLDASVTYGIVIVAMLILGTGLGLTVAPLLIAAQNAVPKERLGAATSLTQFTRSMGAAIGLAIMGTLMASAFGGREPEGIIQFRARMDPVKLRDEVGQLVLGLKYVFRTTALAAALGVVLALAIPTGKAAELKMAVPAESS
jgi:EmrB/QacA subfamily drug resistance transporter